MPDRLLATSIFTYDKGRYHIYIEVDMADSSNTYGNSREVLGLAVKFLATGTGSIQERLENAAMMLITLSRPSPELSPELNGELSAMIQDITKTPSQGSEGKIKATLRRMSDEECAAIAQRIISLYRELTTECEVRHGFRSIPPPLPSA
jgi:hypothetical protein